MRALVKQKPKSRAEVFFESDWLDWMDPETGAPLNADPYKYGLCENATSSDPADYAITSQTVEDEDGNPVTTYTAVQTGGF